ncbi:MAG: hypothetical protein AAFO07_28460, partial [Bacteroidota bacterium]
KVVAQTRTYARAKTMQVNPGSYRLEFKAMKIKGAGAIHNVSDINLEANQTQTIAHNFESSLVKIGASGSDGLVDATIYIKDIDKNTTVAQGRTYKSDTSNPRTFVLTPGNYEASLKALGTYNGKKQIIKFSVEAGKNIEKVVSF